MARLVHLFQNNASARVNLVSSPVQVGQFINVLDTATPQPRGNLPIPPGANIAFVVMGVFGQLEPIGGQPAQQALASAEIRVFVGNQPTNHHAKMSFTLGTHQTPTLPRGHPFCFVVHVPSYVAASPLRLMARINPQNASNPTQVGGQFRVQGVTILAFDLSVMTAAGHNFVIDQHLLSGGVTMPASPTPAVLRDVFLPFYAATSRDFVVFASTSVVAGSLLAPYELRMRLEHPTNPVDFLTAWGAVSRGPTGSGTILNAAVLDGLGAFTRVDTIDDASYRIQLLGRSAYGPVADPPATFYQSGILAIPLDVFHQATLEAVRYTSLTAHFGDHPSGGTASHVWAPPIGPGTLLQASDVSNFQPLEYLVVACSSSSSLFGSGAVNVRHFIRHNQLWIGPDPDLRPGGQFNLYSYIRGAGPPGSGPERIPTYQSGRMIPRVQNQLAVRGFISEVEPVTPAGGIPVFHPAGFLSVLAMFPDEGAPPQPPGGPVAGPVIKVSVGREAPALGALTALPISPSWVQPVELVGIEAGEFLAEAGYALRWPLFSKPRRLVRFTWNGKSPAEKDQLQDFFRNQAQAAFKNTLLGETTERAFVHLVGSFQATELGRSTWTEQLLYRVETRAVELVWIGP